MDYHLIVWAIAIIVGIARALGGAAKKSQRPPTLPQQYVPPTTFGAPPAGAPYTQPPPGGWAPGQPAPPQMPPYGNPQRYGEAQPPPISYGAPQPPPQYQYAGQQTPPLVQYAPAPNQAAERYTEPPPQVPYGAPRPMAGGGGYAPGMPYPPAGPAWPQQNAAAGYAPPQQTNWTPMASAVATPPPVAAQAGPAVSQPYQFQVGSSMEAPELGQFDNDAALRKDARQMKAREPGAAKTAEESSRVDPVRKLTDVLAEKDPLVAAFIMHEILSLPRSRRQSN